MGFTDIFRMPAANLSIGLNVTCNVRLIKIANGVAISDESRLLVEDYSYTVYDPFRSGHTVKCVETTILRKP